MAMLPVVSKWLSFQFITTLSRGHAMHIWFRHCATSQKLTGSIPGIVDVIFR